VQVVQRTTVALYYCTAVAPRPTNTS